ncbi:hypothetical protein CKO28_09510 [Rhodovibrio sodomensis]|uniref:Peptidase C39-like domain-containing protein n=1 Tax=Rhodovibrio sodomensis TaxID=1088 RepID=A0ABS1DEB9_9PROT|nr:hypothetical protein [Rhodovibrio sodomensis]MBK1668272.1 hypothetical protein [Rhodovibrio sodomensis]
MPEIDKIGELNQTWGICGFASALYALYQDTGDRSRRSQLARRVETDTNLLAEIKTFLVTLHAENQTGLLNQIEQFTRSFPGFGQFTVNGYIAKVNSIGAAGIGPVGDLKADAKFSIALPPDAVAFYLKRMCDFPRARVEPHIGSRKSRLVVGVRKRGGKTTPYGGLVHWMYQSGGTVYSWGRQFSSIAKADRDYVVCSEVSPYG